MKEDESKKKQATVDKGEKTDIMDPEINESGDYVWGPELELGPDVNDFLNSSQRYKPILESIYAGLGIPKKLMARQLSGDDA